MNDRLTSKQYFKVRVLDNQGRVINEPKILANNRLLFEKIIDGFNLKRPIIRVFIMGCGRSGTWLLTAMTSTLRNVCLIPKELPIESFAIFNTNESGLVIKRCHNSYKRVADIPMSIKVLYIIRHPFDVLTSFNRNSGRKYHIDVDRWIGEIKALQFLVDSRDKNLKIFKYEDLVNAPEKAQVDLASFFETTIQFSVNELPDIFQAPEEAVTAMHGLRKIDTNSIGNWKKSVEKVNYLREIKPLIEEHLNWLSEYFDYDIDL